MVESVLHGEQILSIIIRTKYEKPGISFFTPNDFSQQLAYMQRPKDYVIAPHVHNHIAREVTLTKEVLFIKSGMVRVDFYDEAKCYIESRILYAGDVILLAHGGHGFSMLEKSEIIEVKQGPYMAERDKVRFDPVSSDKVRIVTAEAETVEIANQ